MKVKSVLVSQPKPISKKSPYFDLAERYGLKIDFRPFIKVDPVSAKEFRQQKISILDYSAVIFTARTAIDHFFRLCEEMRITIPETMKYFCVTEQVALYLQKYIVYRKRKVFHAPDGKLDGLMTLVQKHAAERFIVPVSDVHKDDLLSRLDEKSIQYSKAIMYCTVSNDFGPDEPFDYDMVVFFSPSGVQSLLKNFPNYDQKDMKIASFGSATAKTVRDSGLRLDVEAPSPEYPSMTAAIDAFLKENHKAARK